MTQGYTKGVPIDTDPTMTLNSNQVVPSQAAVVTYVGAQVAAATAIKTITGDTGGPLSPTLGNMNTLGSGSITIAGSSNTLTTQLTGLTNHNVLVGAGTSTITKVAPSATSGVALISQGAAADPTFGTVVVAGGGTGLTTLTAHALYVGNATSSPTALAIGSTGQVLQANTGADPGWSTATYPSTATGTGTILRADGTNWSATTATYPTTTTVNRILYSSSANVVGEITTANSGVLATNSSGVPSINTSIAISSAGEVTMPSQPAFLASNSLASNVTGDGTTYTMVYANEIYDQNSDFDGTSTFTAPVTGRYLFCASIVLGELSASFTAGSMRIVTSNRTITADSANYGAERSGSNILIISVSHMVDMDAADTCTIDVTVSGSTKTVDTNANGYFSGTLMC